MSDRFGEQIPFCEPAWYQGGHSPYYSDEHRKFRAVCRKFVEEELVPYVDDWIEASTDTTNGYPQRLHQRAFELGITAGLPKEYGGKGSLYEDPFFELIAVDEMARVGGAGVMGQVSINSMALPPITLYGSQYLKDKIVKDVITGKKNISLAISEPSAGSDVASIQCSAVEEGDCFVVNGVKKWITGGLMADYFTLACRTGGPGMAGISLLVLEKGMPGLSVRRLKTQFDNTHNTTMVTLEDVRVPKCNLIGRKNHGFMYIMANFNHERFVIAAGAARLSRTCYEQAIKYAMVRKTFGKPLISHQVIRAKLAEMARMIEALQDNIERVCFQFKSGVPDAKMGSYCALLKVNASRTLDFCAREASQIFGGSSIVKEGKGKLVERMYREVRAMAIPGGSEEILLDFVMRQVARKAKSIAEKQKAKAKL
mmetsp:Transcript_37901/g.74564  ORF Transcript_37901/g.74564 Transcript_37901/m.74564 type:complete len:426 (+) Transcript_37901:41-1318(+)